MTHRELLGRIEVNPGRCFGKPVIRGTRIWVVLILDFLAEGWSEKEILENYPHLTPDDISACLAHASEAARGRYFDVPAGSAP